MWLIEIFLDHVIIATFTGSPLLISLLVTVAVSSVPEFSVFKPASLVTISLSAVAAVTMPVTPSLNSIMFLPGVVEKPKPTMTRLVAVGARSVELGVIKGTIVATCSVTLLIPLTVTVAMRLPAA